MPITTILRLNDIVRNDMSIVKTPVACLHHVNAMLRLLEEGHAIDARVPRTCYDALQMAILHGDQVRVRVFAQDAYDRRVALKGGDVPEPRSLKDFIKRPSSHTLWYNAVFFLPRNGRFPVF